MLIVLVVSVKNVKKEKHEFAYRSVTVCPHILAVMCIYVIYKCLS